MGIAVSLPDFTKNREKGVREMKVFSFKFENKEFKGKVFIDVPAENEKEAKKKAWIKFEKTLSDCGLLIGFKRKNYSVNLLKTGVL